MASATLIGIVLALGASSASGQTMWAPPYRTNQIAFQWTAPTLGGGSVQLRSGAAYLDVSYALTSHLELISEVPFAYNTGGAVDSIGSATAVGNPYVGVGLSATSMPLLLEVGVRIPLTPDNSASSAGTLTDVGRSSGFRPEEKSASALVSWRYLLGHRLSLRVRGGAVVAQFPDSTGNNTLQERVQYGAQVWYEGDPVLAGVSAVGRAAPLAAGSFRDKSVHHLVASVMLNIRPIQPGIFLGATVDQELWDVAPVLIGLTVSTSYR